MSAATVIHCDHHDDYGNPDCTRTLTIGIGFSVQETRRNAWALGWGYVDPNTDYCEQHTERPGDLLA